MVTLSPEVRSLYPFQSRYADLSGVRCHYLDEGPEDGEPVVMVHGNPTWSFYYRGLVQALGGRYRAIVPDHVGCGLSDRPSDALYSYRLERRVEDLERLLEQLGVTKNVTLVLHDWGGMIGLAYATRHPERVKRLVLTNTSGFQLPRAKKLPLALKLARTPFAGPFLVRGLNAFSLGTVKTCSERRLAPAVARGYLSPYANWHDRLAVLRFVEDIPLDPSHPSWEAVAAVERALPRLAHIPTMILWGARDFVFDDHFLDGFRMRLPHATVHRFADAGHLLFEDEPEKSFALVREFLQ